MLKVNDFITLKNTFIIEFNLCSENSTSIYEKIPSIFKEDGCLFFYDEVTSYININLSAVPSYFYAIYCCMTDLRSKLSRFYIKFLIYDNIMVMKTRHKYILYSDVHP